MKKNTFTRPDVLRVVKHLRGLYKSAPKTKEIPKLLAHRRYVVENYGNIDGNIPIIEPTIKVEKIKVRTIDCEWLCHENADPQKRLMYLHGGAFIAGSLDSHRPLAAELSKRAGVAVLLVDYRRAPEYPYPAGLDDCIDAYNWMVENNLEGKEKATHTFIAGDSAGGNLTLACLLKIKDSELKMPNAALAISPPTDLAGKSVSVTTLNGFDPILEKKAYKVLLPLVYLFGKEALKIQDSWQNKVNLVSKIVLKKKRLVKNPYVSPIYGNLEGLPPIFINVGDVEILRDDSIRFVDKARKAGTNASIKVWPDMIHVFVAFMGYLPEAEQCIDEMSDFIKKYSV